MDVPEAVTSIGDSVRISSMSIPRLVLSGFDVAEQLPSGLEP